MYCFSVAYFHCSFPTVNRAVDFHSIPEALEEGFSKTATSYSFRLGLRQMCLEVEGRKYFKNWTESPGVEQGFFLLGKG